MSQVLRTKNKDVNLGPALEFARSLRELAVVDPEAAAAISIVLNFGDDDVPPAAAARIATAAREALAAHRNVLAEHCRWVLGEVAKASKERVEWRAKSVDNAAAGQGRWVTIRGHAVFIGGKAAVFSSEGDKFPTVSQSKAQMKAAQELYDTDEEFRGAVKATVLFTSGGFKEVRAVDSMLGGHEVDAASANLPKDTIDNIRSSIKTGSEVSISRFANPMASYVNPLDSNADSILHAKEDMIKSVKALNTHYEAQDPLNVPVYRGVLVEHSRADMLKRMIDYQQEQLAYPDLSESSRKIAAEQLADYQKIYARTVTHDAQTASLLATKKGDVVSISGFSSFSAERSIADEFATGQNVGQRGKSKKGDLSQVSAAVTYEIEPGAKALSVSRFSKWKQAEVITKGSFTVTDVVSRDEDGVKYVHIKMKQTTSGAIVQNWRIVSVDAALIESPFMSESIDVEE